MKVYVITESTPDGPLCPMVYAGTKAGRKAATAKFYRRVYRACADHTEEPGTAAETLSNRERHKIATAAVAAGWWAGWDWKVELATVRLRTGRSKHVRASR